MIIINADDFGLSKDINLAIFESFKSGLISSTTMIVNINDSFEDALNYVSSKKISNHQIGLHLNLEEGVPLTQGIRDIDFICNSEGHFFFNFRVKNRFFLDKYVKFCVQEELSAQIEKFIDNLGFLPSHVDSHNHTHTEFAMIRSLLPLMKDFKIQNIRLSRNIGPDIQGFKYLYKFFFNQMLKYYKFNTSDFFGDIVDFKGTKFLDGKTYEIMVHPSFNNQGVIVDLCGNSLHFKLSNLFGLEIPKLSSYKYL